MTEELASEACGTYAGYQTHKRVGEEVCDACRHANSAYVRMWRATPEGKAKTRIDREARRHAHQALAKLYPREYRRLFSAAQDRLRGGR